MKENLSLDNAGRLCYTANMKFSEALKGGAGDRLCVTSGQGAGGMWSCSRRSFLGLAGCAAGGVCVARAGVAHGGESYSVALLGDTHFDSTDTKHYHADYLFSTTKGRYEAHLKEHARNAEMWRERMPALIRASAACMTHDTAFALQMGDLVQGDCNNPATHRRMLNDCFSLIKGAYGGRLPLVMVAGNHDIRGDIPTDGAREAFDAWQPPMMAKELGQTVTGTTFSFRHGPDAFIVVDFNGARPDFALVKRLFAESKGARHTFLVTHGPAIPSGASRWFLLGAAKRDAERRELLRIMAAHNTIVLAGHTHCLEFYDCVLPEGRVTQLVASSVWSSPALATPSVKDEGAAAYGNRAKAGKRGKQGRRALVEEYRPFVRGYFHAAAAGHYRLEVGPTRVAAVFYGGASTVPTRTFVLRG